MRLGVGTGHHRNVTVVAEAGVLETVTGAATLDEIGAMLDRMWSVHGHVPDAVRTQVAIAVGEIGANIMEHAARGGAVRLRMEVRVLSDAVHVTFTDDGSPAQVDLTDARMPGVMAEHGRGLALARAVLERLFYRRAIVNQWTLVSRRFA